METLAIVLGAFVFGAYVQTHEVGRPLAPRLDSERMELRLKRVSEFEDVVSTKTVAPNAQEVFLHTWR